MSQNFSYRKRRYRSGRPHVEDTTPPTRKLDEGRLGHFRYDAKRALERSEALEDANVPAFLQTLTAKASRQGVADAKRYVSEKVAEGVIAPPDQAEIDRLLDRYATYR